MNVLIVTATKSEVTSDKISNFLLYQVAYTELHYTKVLWPDFKEDDLLNAIIDYQGRERRFGMTQEQIIKA